MNILTKVLKRKERKASRTAVAIGSVHPGGTIWTERDYENFAKETYMKNVIAFRSIQYIAMSVSSVPWKLFKQIGEGDKEEINDHPFNLLLKRANPKTSWMMLMYSHISYFCMSGNAFMERVRLETGPNTGQVRELWPLRPDRIKINVDQKTGLETGYIYCVNGREINYPIDPITMQSDVLHIKMFNPVDDFWGMATTEPAARKIDTYNSADTWNKKLMDNSGRPGLIYHFKEQLGDIQYETLMKRIRKEVEGAENAGKTKIVEGADSVEPFGWTPAELDWIKSNLELARSICIAWGVPPQLIGIPDSQTYSNYEEARAAFWEETVMFYLSLTQCEFDAWLFPEEDITLSYCLDEVSALQYKRDLMWKRAQDSDFLTINEKRAMAGYDAVDEGDVILQPATMIPIGTGMENEEDTIEDEEDEARQALVDQGYNEDEINVLMDSEPGEGKPFQNEHACRLNPPDKYDNFRRQNNWRKHNGKRIDAIWGIKSGKSELQAIRMPKDEWSAGDARKYCSDQGGSFEAAG